MGDLMNGLYIHIPFCIKKCYYCDFASFPSLISKSDEYIDAICTEMKLYKGEKIDTIYLGGGTPSILNEYQFDKIISTIYSVFDVSQNSEITLEANPCTVDDKKAKFLYNLGINRVSLGAQSFVDSELLSLGRIHNSIDIIRSYNCLIDAGFDNISLDLMYALPGQTMSSLMTSLKQITKLSPKHISCYGLKIEDNTAFSQMLSDGKIMQKSDDEYADMYEVICSYLGDNGYNQYELSNFSLDLFESKHNLKYWTLKDYIGIGLSASSCYNGKRYTRTHDFNKYLKSFENDEIYELTQGDKMSEYMILSLRLVSYGVNKTEFKNLFGKSIEEVFSHPLKKHLSLGLLIDMGDRYVLSKKAYYISNSVLCDFI